jgi:hypothetical protein
MLKNEHGTITIELIEIDRRARWKRARRYGSDIHNIPSSPSVRLHVPAHRRGQCRPSTPASSSSRLFAGSAMDERGLRIVWLCHLCQNTAAKWVRYDNPLLFSTGLAVA